MKIIQKIKNYCDQSILFSGMIFASLILVYWFLFQSKPYGFLINNLPDSSGFYLLPYMASMFAIELTLMLVMATQVIKILKIVLYKFFNSKILGV